MYKLNYNKVFQLLVANLRIVQILRDSQVAHAASYFYNVTYVFYFPLSILFVEINVLYNFALQRMPLLYFLHLLLI